MIELMIDVLLGVVYIVVAGIMVAVGWRVQWALRHFTNKTIMTPATVIEDKPSVSIVIPARNEDHAMTDCLQSALQTTYPKVEFIVMDDSSADKTSSLIKAFAHDGVRFIEGHQLPAEWLGKNYALHRLVQEASGTYVLFMDVDTRLSPDSVEQMVAYTEQEQAHMVSIMPRREDGLRLGTIFSPLRYFWEIIFHTPAKPAVASSAWLVRKSIFMDSFDGFEGMKDVVQPESKVAALFASQQNYRFLMSTPSLGITYTKKWSSQVETSIRLLYPLLGARVAHSLIALLDLLIVLSPVLVLATGFVVGWNIHHIVAGVLWFGFAVIYGTYTRRVWRKGWLLGAILWNFSVIQELILIVKSTIQYKRNKITWKGRHIPLPSELRR
jgi:glycosyltransferase involved in cell wall biosynthesis